MAPGTAEIIRDRNQMGTFLAAVNATVRVRPRVTIALWETDFSGSPTRWTFPDQQH
jgi:hypothetical protein